MILLGFILSVSLYSSNACACGVHTTGKVELPSDFFKATNRKPSQSKIPQFPGTNYESQLGNLILESGKEVIISIPAQLKRSDSDRPFGDGQTNAKLDINNWKKEQGFIAVGIQTKKKGKVTRAYRFHSSLNIVDYKEEALGQNWFRVTPAGWSGEKPYFYFNFDTSALRLKDFLKGIPTELRRFSDGRVAPDPEKIGNVDAYNKLNTQRGLGYPSQPWPAAGVHDFFKGERTAVGGINTWGIVEKAFGPFKQLYTCFDERRTENELKFQVPSGAGWHHVGDPAETLINNLEKLPIPAAIGRTHKFEKAAYDLTDTVTGFWLTSNYAFVTVNDQFHWYVNPYPKIICTEIWVHNCIPDQTNNWGFKCPWK